jgi:hypothetical protein
LLESERDLPLHASNSNQKSPPMLPDPTAAAARNTRTPNGELARIAVLALVAVWLLHPFATTRAIGAGDALWYANMLADFCLQWRAGVFPVFVGQTEFAFNGAIYPLRVAPLYQHWGGTIDLLTGRTLSFFTLQNLIVLTVGVAGLGSAYICLRKLSPARPWRAVFLAILYVSCPGALSFVYTQDLHMSWMTLPFLPVVFYGVVRSFKEDDWTSWLCIAAGLALLWLAHAPIAMWASAVVAITQLLRLSLVHRTRSAWLRAGAAALIFLALGSYPFVSLDSLKSDSVPPPATAAPLEKPEQIVQFLRSAIPGALLPLSDAAGQLSDVQLGYGLWGLLLVALVGLTLHRNLLLALLVAAALVLVTLVLPIPGWSELFWLNLAPESVRRLTYYWPMHRLYVILAALIPFAAQLARQSVTSNKIRLDRHAHLALVVAAAWSCWEARQFVRAGENRTASVEQTARRHRPENLLLMNHAYGLYSKLPAYFSHGVMDPYAEIRLLDPKTGAPLPGALAGPSVTNGDFIGTPDANPGIINLAPKLRLEPGKRYDLRFEFPEHGHTGILQIVGTSLFREYVLPASGEPRAFGALPHNSPHLPLWTSGQSTEIVSLRLIPTTSNTHAKTYARFARFEFRERPLVTSQIYVTSLIPFRAHVESPSAALLETPRMFLPGYVATVNGSAAHIRPSKEALLAIDVPAGSSELSLTYKGPPHLRVSYWFSLGAWTFLAAILLIATLRPRFSSPRPAA